MRALLCCSLLATGCAELLGLDEFTPTSASASAASSSASTSAAGGSAGSVGSGGSGDAGTAGAAGTANGGNGGAAGCGSGGANAHYVFASEATVSPLVELTSVAKANSLCTGWAMAAGLSPTSTWKAWLSEGSLSAAQNVGSQLDGWYRCDGIFVTADPSIAVTPLNAPIAVTEHGDPVTGNAWTGTMPNGTTASTCSNWQAQGPTDIGTIGRITETGPNWTSFGLHDCDTAYRLYCFQVSL